MGDPRTPTWVANVRDEIGRSPAWEVLSDQLYERVSIVLRSHGLGHFSDLSSAEQITLLEEAHREIASENNKVYQAFESQFSKSMDGEIAKEARVRIDQDEGAKRYGADEALYLDRILETAAEGAVALLRELPREHLGSLRLMLNQPIPSRARLEIWKLLLRDTSAREDYELLMKQNRNSTISGQDIYITHRCQALLESGRVATCRLLPLTSRNVVLMKTVLSHHHACKMSKRGQKATVDVPESYVHFLVPLCAVVIRGEPFSSASTNASAGAPPREQKIELMIEDLVEMFESGLEAGLKGLVDPRELAAGAGAGGGVGGGGTERILPRGKKSGSSVPTGNVVKTDRDVVEAAEDSGGKDQLPAWVEVAHAALVTGYQELVDHVARVHLGLAVAVAEGANGASSAVTEVPPPKTEIDNPQAEEDKTSQDKSTDCSPAPREGSTSHAAQTQASSSIEAGAAGAVNPKNTGTGKADDSTGRRRSSRRAVLLARRASSSADAGAGSAANHKITGGGIDAGDDPMRRSSSLSQGGTEEKKEEESMAGASNPSEDVAGKTVALPVVDPSQTRAALWALLKPMVTVGLVGYLGAEACLFAWDQAVVGGFGVMLPRVAAMMVAAAGQKLEACVTFTVMCEALLSHAQLLSTSQLQELMEGHCMPALREEMKVSEKLSPTIIGPTLKTATEILDSAYSKRTREAQEARQAHVEHILGPTGGSERDGRSRLLRLDLSQSHAETDRAGEGGRGWGAGGGEREEGDAPRRKDGNDRRRSQNRGGRVEGKKGGHRGDSDEEGSDERSARLTTTTRGQLSHRGTSNSVERGKAFRRDRKSGEGDVADGHTGKDSRKPKRDASKRRASRDRKPQRRGETETKPGSSGGAVVGRSRRRTSAATGDPGATGDKRKGGKRLPSTNSGTAKGETVTNGINSGSGQISQPTKRAAKNNDNGRKDGGRRPSSGLSTSRGGSASLVSSSSGPSRNSRSREQEAIQTRSSTGQKGRSKPRVRDSFIDDDEGEAGHPATGKAPPRARNQRAGKVIAGNGNDITSSNVNTAGGGSTPGGERSGTSDISRGSSGGRQTLSEADEVEKAQMAVYKRVYTDDQIDELTGDECEAYVEKQPEFVKALRALRAAREAAKQGEGDAETKSKKSDVKRGKKNAARAAAEEKQKAAGPVWEEEGESEFSPLPAEVSAPISPLKRWLGIGGKKR